MGDSNDDGIPAWQRTSETDSSTAASAEATPAARNDAGSDAGAETTTEYKLIIARRFLDDENVKNEPRDKKVAFLQSKGVEDEHIQTLLGEAHDTPADEAAPAASTTPQPVVPAAAAAADRAPIVTYPEFLTKAQRPPPLVTTQGLLATIYGFAGLSTIVYGASKYIVEPMTESLNGARQELHDTTASKLEELIHQLERTVSVIPPSPPSQKDNAVYPGSALTSSATTIVDEDDEDPAEMFHRDIGTQTSLNDALASNGNTAAVKPEAQALALQHATNLAKLAKGVSGLRDAVVSQSGDFEDIKAQVEHFREDLDKIIFPHMDFTPGGGYGMLSGSKNEPDDEVRKARDNIRRIKGVLLSTRSFPASTR